MAEVDFDPSTINIICTARVDTSLPKPLFELISKRSNINGPTLSNGSRYTGQLIDAPVHVDPPGRNLDINTEALTKILNTIQTNSVDIAVLMPTPNDGRYGGYVLGVTQRIALDDLAPDKIKLFAGSNYITYWLHQICHDEEVSYQLDDVLTQLSEDISSGDYAGVGEIGVLHFIKKPGQALIAFRPNFAPFLDVVEEVAKHDLWLNLHMEPVDPDGA